MDSSIIIGYVEEGRSPVVFWVLPLRIICYSSSIIIANSAEDLQRKYEDCYFLLLFSAES